MYHDSDRTTSTLTLTDDLFANNRAEYNNNSDSYNYRGGGAFEEYRASSYTSRYYFSFFTRNTAPKGVGNDISIHTKSLPLSNIIHCFTTRAQYSLWNTKYKTYETWLPQGSIYFVYLTSEGKADS